MTDDPRTPLVLAPSAAAARLGVSVASLVTLVRHYGYAFTELALGGRPGDRGRGRWGMTAAQIVSVVRGQARAVAKPTALPRQGNSADVTNNLESSDSVSRVEPTEDATRVPVGLT